MKGYEKAAHLLELHVQPNENGPGEAATSRDRDTERIELSMPSDHTPKTKVESKTCCRCGDTKPTTEFYYRNENPVRLRGHCKACHYRHRSSATRWTILQDSLRRRVGGGPVPSSKQLRKALDETQSCYICGESIESELISLDHVQPIGRGGTNDITNLRWVHRSCNQVKHDLTLPELVQLARLIVSTHGNERGL